MMNDTMPTTPRSGSVHTAGAAAARVGSMSVATATALITRPSLVAAVGVFRMFQIPERTPARDRRDRREVVRRRRGAHGPFECPGVPRIVSGPFAFPIRDDQVRH